ncbi:MAG: HNH endonuclease [Promethearchaeota archaeon]
MVPKKNGGTDIPANLITLCKQCHEEVHNGIKHLSTRTIKTSIHRNIQFSKLLYSF